jgi:putative membrane protein
MIDRMPKIHFGLSSRFAMTISDLPAVNATLNATSTVFISLGWWFIRRGFWRQHIACMITAVCSSTVFLTSYLIYHFHVGEKSTHFTAPGIVRPIYFALLISHILLAFITLPLVIATLIPAFRRRWEKHRRIAKWTMPIWLYVSLTGVLVYLMLYQWFPPASLALGQ